MKVVNWNHVSERSKSENELSNKKYQILKKYSEKAVCGKKDNKLEGNPQTHEHKWGKRWTLKVNRIIRVEKR